MEKERLENIFLAIKKDDLKLFSSQFSNAQELNIRFGRFALLSVLYLFKSYNILCKYESQLLKIGKYEEVQEFYEIYKTFKMRAKKSLRLFVNNDFICYPILMLAILNEKDILINNYKNLYKNAEIVDKIKKIYILTWNYDVIASTDFIEIKQKKHENYLFKIITSIFLSLCLILSIFSITYISISSGIGTESTPILVSTEEELKTALEAGGRYYKLTQDITLSSEFTSNSFSGVLDGNEKTIYVSGQSKPLVTNLTGSIMNLKIQSEKITIKISQNFAILAENCSGNVKNIQISAEIDIEFINTSDSYFTLFACKNAGTIDNCTAEISGSAKNSAEVNAYVTGFVGENSGVISNSKTLTGTIESDTVDMAGFAIENTGTITGVINNLSLTQTSSKEWHPNTSGIVNSNTGTIEYAINYGNISGNSDLETESSKDNYYQVLTGGIVCQNGGKINYSRNFGDITCTSKISITYAGGIAAVNYLNDESDSAITYSKSKGCVKANSSEKSKLNSSNGIAYAGGIAGFSSTSIENSGFEGEISIGSLTTGFGGGIVGWNDNSSGQSIVKNCYTSVNFKDLNEDSDDYTKVTYFSGIIGVLYTYYNIYFQMVIPCDNNYYYIENNSITCAIILYNSGFEELADENTGATSCEKDDIFGLEVYLNDEI